MPLIKSFLQRLENVIKWWWCYICLVTCTRLIVSKCWCKKQINEFVSFRTKISEMSSHNRFPSWMHCFCPYSPSYFCAEVLRLIDSNTTLQELAWGKSMWTRSTSLVSGQQCRETTKFLSGTLKQRPEWRPFGPAPILLSQSARYWMARETFLSILLKL